MARILCIETSTTVCSVSLSIDGKAIFNQETDEGYSHAEKLALFVGDVMDSADLELSSLNAIAAGSGPGSYTGMRIGLSTAKGLCYSLDKPLIAVPTTRSMTLGAITVLKEHGKADENTLFCPMIDARRMEVYCEVYDINLKHVYHLSADVIDSNSFSELLKHHKVYFFGDGAAKCASLFESNPNADFSFNARASSEWMAPLAEQAFSETKFEDLALFEPNYFKEFRSGK
ncbi:MAG: tRNA (adenosine(37)-N6)-threonylcarbamoyltransferase complex dimerization subunit type 1 TsaB [Bacteroidetes bacterium]|nr:MAG: tRNA (adenosine(37)-N6)-threonylcarbamoyltransferase complex dimerization subunit type 1 TsaB [Bacteroidota bacterium]REK04931.1 MAG: tRNA (adenosine(37)-N6)-threonylcarbamoyltransferase complex dimerization subunit type 1 TsaB [Bacteroidota bacterium]REK36565.1 MAG: tRNA (adenosine(37)-N6)-threonylcarbamoyltransferase complex dimerization subunit type 1 TsaB [Bacteroidota bacterium]REK50931.1 MAG: tRNA (adenosine(37)-N6)-threonylcarbamoyltransferase complex dimerization subunit type 1 T